MKLIEINIYPVKSTRRIALQSSEVLPRGLPLDRRWMLVDEAGMFITARQHPLLATVQTAIAGAQLTVRVDGRAELHLHQPADGQESARVKVWKDEVDARLVSAAADAWFSGLLGVACRLVYMSDELVRPVDPAYGQPGDEVSFADGFPLLLISEASLADLNSRLAEPVDMRRFRPNLVVDGAVPYAEDGWRRFRVGEVEFEGVKNCSRCVFTTVDPDLGVKHPALEPLKTLGSYRRRAGGGVFFGQNVIPRGTGVIRVGDAVTLPG